MTLQDFMGRVIDTAAVTALATPVGGAMAHYASKVKDASLSPDDRLVYMVAGTHSSDIINGSR